MYILTGYGQACLRSEPPRVGPEDPTGYLEELEGRLGKLDDVIATYLGEALSSFKYRNLVASMVMRVFGTFFSSFPLPSLS